MAEVDEFLTVKQVAEQLQVNPQTVRNWIDRGELLAVRAGQRRVRIRSRDLDAFLGAAPMGESEAREAFADALARTQTTGDDAELAAALRELSRSAETLARALDRPGG